MKKTHIVLVVILSLLLPTIAISGSRAKDIDDRIWQIKEGKCITGDCHAGMRGKKYIHELIAEQDCKFCHQAAAGEHKFTFLAEKGAAICLRCHDFTTDATTVDCLECHDPHGSGRLHQLKDDVSGACPVKEVED